MYSETTEHSTQNRKAIAVIKWLAAGVVLLSLNYWMGVIPTASVFLVAVLTALLTLCLLIRVHFISIQNKPLILTAAFIQYIQVFGVVLTYYPLGDLTQIPAKLAQWFGIQFILAGVITIILPFEFVLKIFPRRRRSIQALAEPHCSIS